MYLPKPCDALLFVKDGVNENKLGVYAGDNGSSLLRPAGVKTLTVRRVSTNMEVGGSLLVIKQTASIRKPHVAQAAVQTEAVYMHSRLSHMTGIYIRLSHCCSKLKPLLTSYKVLAANNCVRLRVKVFPLDSAQPKRALRFLHRDPVKSYPRFPCLLVISRRTVMRTTRIHHFAFLAIRKSLRNVCDVNCNRSIGCTSLH